MKVLLCQLYPLVWISSRDMLSILAIAWSWYSEVIDSIQPTRIRQELKNPRATHITVHWDFFPMVLSDIANPDRPSLLCWSCLWIGMFCMRWEILASLPSLTEVGRNVGRSTRDREEPLTRVTFLPLLLLLLASGRADLFKLRSILTVCWCFELVWLQADWVGFLSLSLSLVLVISLDTSNTPWENWESSTSPSLAVSPTSDWLWKVVQWPLCNNFSFSSSSSHFRMSCKLSDGITAAWLLSSFITAFQPWAQKLEIAKNPVRMRRIFVIMWVVVSPSLAAENYWGCWWSEWQEVNHSNSPLPPHLQPPHTAERVRQWDSETSEGVRI